MILGGPIFDSYDNPEKWADAVVGLGYGAAYCPIDNLADDALIDEYAKAARRENIIIAEVGAWSNPLSTDINERNTAILYCKKQLELADKIGACCCVHISGSRGKRWDGPHPDNFSDETFDMIVATIRDIIDDVKPVNTFFTLELMPWMYPDSADSYLRLIEAIDRKQFAAHLDPVNIICSPRKFFNNSYVIKECFEKLGPYIKSCHAKDIALSDTLTTHLDEVRVGLGSLDYHTYIRQINKLDKNIPLMLEHLTKPEEYKAAAEYIRNIEKDKAL